MTKINIKSNFMYFSLLTFEFSTSTESVLFCRSSVYVGNNHLKVCNPLPMKYYLHNINILVYSLYIYVNINFYYCLSCLAFLTLWRYSLYSGLLL